MYHASLNQKVVLTVLNSHAKPKFNRPSSSDNISYIPGLNNNYVKLILNLKKMKVQNLYLGQNVFGHGALCLAASPQMELCTIEAILIQ